MTRAAQFRGEVWQMPVAVLPLLDRSADVPVLPSTVLGLELLLNEPVIDLRLAAELILSDPGATLHTLRMAGCEDAPLRVEDCLAGLELSSHFEMLTAHAMKFGSQGDKAAAFWRHAREIAQYARFLAESMENVAPDMAYLVGLFHELDTLPRVLGWTGLVGAQSPYTIGADLPGALKQALEDARGNPVSPWRYAVEAAHQLTCGAPPFCPLIPFSSLEEKIQ